MSLGHSMVMFTHCVCYVVDQVVAKDVVEGEVEVRCVVLQDVVLSAVKVSKNEMGGRICNPVMMTPKHPGAIVLNVGGISLRSRLHMCILT